MKRVVITGLGVIAPTGNDTETFWSAIKNGVCGVRHITRFDTEGRKVKCAAEADFDGAGVFPPGELRKMDRFCVFAVAAAMQAHAQSGIAAENTDSARCAVVVSSGIGGLETIEREHARGIEKGFDRVSPFFIPMVITNMAAGRISIETGFKGHSSAVVTACAGGANAVGDAFRLIRHGYADAALCGGAEAVITPLAIGGFTAMKALSESEDPARASIPFDAERSGFVMGEGAGILMLEELEHARARGANIIAEVTGYGATCDAYHITAPDPAGSGGAAAMAEALRDAGLKPEDISYINAHGTSTPLNDKGETQAVKSVFGEHAKALPVSSTKSMTGHLLGAAGAVEALICALAVRDGFVPATINHKVDDPECDLDIVPNEGRSAPLRHAMSNSLGFGGHNASLIISRYEQEG